jgi:hypothetical protein
MSPGVHQHLFPEVAEYGYDSIMASTMKEGTRARPRHMF